MAAACFGTLGPLSRFAGDAGVDSLTLVTWRAALGACVVGVFIHPGAADDKKIYDYNYEATKMAVKNAMEGKPTVDEMIAGKDAAAHPFRGF